MQSTRPRARRSIPPGSSRRAVVSIKLHVRFGILGPSQHDDGPLTDRRDGASRKELVDLGELGIESREGLLRLGVSESGCLDENSEASCNARLGFHARRPLRQLVPRPRARNECRAVRIVCPKRAPIAAPARSREPCRAERGVVLGVRVHALELREGGAPPSWDVHAPPARRRVESLRRRRARGLPPSSPRAWDSRCPRPSRRHRQSGRAAQATA